MARLIRIQKEWLLPVTNMEGFTAPRALHAKERLDPRGLQGVCATATIASCSQTLRAFPAWLQYRNTFRMRVSSHLIRERTNKPVEP
jgi:hypothetical protein